ncbi:MAG TPA: hypothetical protein VFK54_01620 [Candidatus Limnocylindrales bacterium]|nr:hypothetical protein [Candidatus Limnocylindrales bacterium]
MSIDPGAGPDPTSTAGPAFAHASEAELARILDFYAVRWEYEPHTFPILWSLDGSVIESFTPDFFLPDLDLYIELTTLKQKLVRKKNRKLRRLRELYPGVRIKLFYARDFKMLMLKFGRVDLFEELSGTTGQVVASRADAPDEAGLVAAAETLADIPADPTELPAPLASVTTDAGPGPLAGDPPGEPVDPPAPKRPRRGRNARRRRRQRDAAATNGAD